MIKTQKVKLLIILVILKHLINNKITKKFKIDD